MYLTSTNYAKYTTTSTNNEKINKEGISQTKGQDYVLKTLDDEGNELLNQILEGKTDQEKWMLKLSLDMWLSTDVKNGRVENITDINNSRIASVSSLEAYIEEQKILNAPDIQGTGAIAEKLLEAYKSNATFVNVQYREDSVVDDFLEDLYSKESISFSAKQIKENIQNKVNEYAQILVDEMGDTPEAQLDISIMLNDYKKELLEEYRDSLENSNDGSSTLEQQAIIKVLLDENSKEASHLENFLANDIDISGDKKVDKKSELNNIPNRWLDAIYDDSNSFGMFLKENDKGLESLDKFVENMDEEEKSRFIFVFGHIGNEHLLKAMTDNNLSSPKEAIPYVNDDMKKFNNDLFFAESLEEMLNDKSIDSEVKVQLKEFYKLYTTSLQSAIQSNI